VLIDGLIASAAPDALTPHAERLRLVVLVHMPLERSREHAVLSAAAAIIATSDWTRQQLLELYDLPPERVHVARPGVEPADLAPGSAAGGALLCVAAVTYGKGHDLLLDALEEISSLPWRCACVGRLDIDTTFVAQLRAGILKRGLGDRLRLTGPRTRAELGRAYAAADLLVLPSRAETYGMVITEALARGLPVVAADVGGVREALGGAGDYRPGILVPADHAPALAAALRSWLVYAGLREQLRHAARERRETLTSWSRTAATIAGVLDGEAR